MANSSSETAALVQRLRENCWKRQPGEAGENCGFCDQCQAADALTPQTPCPDAAEVGPRGHVWSNQYGDDWYPEEGRPCDCGKRLSMGRNLPSAPNPNATPRTQEPPENESLADERKVLTEQNAIGNISAAKEALSRIEAHYQAQLATRTAERDALQAKVYVPHQWRCVTCGFVVSKMLLRASDGAVGIDPRDVQDICPNDGMSLTRVTWEAEAKESVQRAIEQLDRAIAAEAQLAALTAANDEAQGQLRAIDNLLARRPALDQPTRYDNIAKAIRVAAHADVALRKQIAAESKLAALTAEGVRLRELAVLVQEWQAASEALSWMDAMKAGSQWDQAAERVARAADAVRAFDVKAVLIPPPATESPA